ncbi:MAG: hypothetical protein AVDCRST_MAG88-2684 [uncultured Thermomicrobiales bacterium]|uniref:ERCC4 domain-containing protein n=1 Tax=uncultured Thermomicrobiales bacterium TaxID=1645740 RepID=A0A6J4VB91_9BACT|nr:MAG: hypothetical protein AVDCRST_MAG88-2684 [uncultured Thermomicrobiales bacterium]
MSDATADAGVVRTDAHRRGSGNLPYLAAFPNVQQRVRTTAMGDFILEEGRTCEREGADDFVASVIDRRLCGQVRALRHSVTDLLLVLEGD